MPHEFKVGDEVRYKGYRVNEDCLVLRTVYLLPTQDERLRELAFVLKISKGELIRRLIGLGLSHKEELLYER